jgi:DNA-binding PadR family transcriptional regulator
VLEEMAQDGILRVARIDEKGRKVYVLTDAGRSPHLIVNPPRKKQ